MNVSGRTPDLGALDLRRLKTLERVGRHGSFSKAASELHFTQSAVSQQIATLERDLDALLVRRNPVALTEAGVALCRRYESAVAELTAAQAELEAFRDGGPSRLRIAASSGAVGKLLTRAIASVSSRHEGLEVLVKSLGPTMSVDAVRRGEVEIAVTHRFAAPAGRQAGMEETQLMRDRLVLAVPHAHALASRQTVWLSELGDESWIHVPELELPWALISEDLQERPNRPKVLFESGNIESAQALVGAGVGITLVPELAVSRDPDVRYVALSGDRVGRSIYAAVRTTAPHDSRVRHVLEALISVARGMTLCPSLGAARDAAAGTHLRALT